MDENGGQYDHKPPPLVPSETVPELKRMGSRVPFVLVSPSVPGQGVLKEDGVKLPGNQFINVADQTLGIPLNHCSMSATLHRWFKTDGFLNARDKESPHFCHVWQPQRGIGNMPPLPFNDTRCPRDQTGRPLEWHPYPDTGTFEIAEAVVVDLYFEAIRPNASGEPLAPELVRKLLERARKLIAALTGSPEYKNAEVFRVSQAGLNGIHEDEQHEGPQGRISFLEEATRHIATTLARALLAPYSYLLRKARHLPH